MKGKDREIEIEERRGERETGRGGEREIDRENGHFLQEFIYPLQQGPSGTEEGVGSRPTVVLEAFQNVSCAQKGLILMYTEDILILTKHITLRVSYTSRPTHVPLFIILFVCIQFSLDF